MASRELLSCPTPSGVGHDNSSAPVRLGVLASGSGSNFEALARAFESVANVEIVLLVCNVPDAPVLARATRLGVASVCIPHDGCEHRQDFEQRVGDALLEHDVEWVLMAGWMRLMSEQFLGRFSGQVLNIHPSLLPAFKGLRALERAWRSGQKIVGCSVHWVVPQMDAGPLVGQAALSIDPHESLEQVRARLTALEHRLYPRAVLAALDSARPPLFSSE